MRPLIDDVLEVLREILSADSRAGSGRSIKDVRLQAVQKVAKAELAKGRFKNWDSAEKSIHDACTRRLQKNLSAEEFDALVKRWLSGQPEGLKSLLGRVDGYGKNVVEAESMLMHEYPSTILLYPGRPYPLFGNQQLS